MGRIQDNGEIQCRWEVMQEFLKMHKGKVAILRVSIQPTEASEKTTNYFFGYIIPELKGAFMGEGEHLDKSQTYDRVRELCPLFHREERENGKWRKRIVEWEELSQEECNEVIDWVVQWAAENLYCVLDLPR